MENSEEFESWLFQLIHDAKIKLGMSERTISYILLREGTHYYLRDILREENGLRDTTKYT